jgi:hypothetical protein
MGEWSTSFSTVYSKEDTVDKSSNSLQKEFRLSRHVDIVLPGFSRLICSIASSTGFPTKLGHDLFSNGASLKSSLRNNTDESFHTLSTEWKNILFEKGVIEVLTFCYFMFTDDWWRKKSSILCSNALLRSILLL